MSTTFVLVSTNDYQPEIKRAVGDPSPGATVGLEVTVHPLMSPPIDGPRIKTTGGPSACVQSNGVNIGYLREADAKRHWHLIAETLGAPVPHGHMYTDACFMVTAEAFADDAAKRWKVRFTLP